MVQIRATSGAIPLSAETYLVERDGNCFRSFFSSTLKLGQLVFGPAEIEAGDVAGETCRIPLVTKPDIGAWVPDSVRKHVTNAAEIEFIDELRYSRNALESPPYVIGISTRSPFLGERLRIEAKMTITPVNESSCVHEYDGVITVRMFGFGALVERMVRDSVIATYRKLPRIIEEWKASRQAAIEEFGPGVVLEGRPPGIDCGIEWIQAYMESMILRGSVPTTELPAMTEPSLSSTISGAISMAMSHQDARGVSSRLRVGVRRIWIAWIDLIKLLFVVVIVLCLRLRIVTVTPSIATQVRHRRKKSWEQFIPVTGHHKTGSGTISDSEDLLRRAHRRRPSRPCSHVSSQ